MAFESPQILSRKRETAKWQAGLSSVVWAVSAHPLGAAQALGLSLLDLELGEVLLLGLDEHEIDMRVERHALIQRAVSGTQFLCF